MKIAAVLTRHRRLLALCGMSAAAHVLVLELVARQAAGVRPPDPQAPFDSLRLRLAPPGQPPAAPPAPIAAPQKPAPAPLPAAPSRPAPVPAAATLVAPPPSPPLPEAGVQARPSMPDAPGAPLMQMPSRYRVRMPDSVRLDYTVERQASGGAPVPAGSARLDWRSDGERYRLELDGVLGRLASSGASGDAGIVPRQAVETAPGAELVTDFDPDARQILFRANGAAAPDAVGMQDRASVLMQLAGMGLAEPDQVRDEIRIVVAGALHADIARFQVLGQEQVQTRAGRLDAWRIAQLAAPGEARLEIWLAPAQGWLPVRLRLTQPDGSSATQTLAAITPGRGG